MSNYHVVPSGSKWLVKANNRVVSTHSTQEKARKSAVIKAKSFKREVVIHGRDGRIRAKDSYGNDPFPPPG